MRRDGRKTREIVLDAALDCFARQGVMAIGIEEIRRHAKASPSSIYHHFGGIEGVMLGLLERTFERLFTHLGERVVPAVTAEEAVRSLVDGHLAWVLDHRVEARVMYQAMALELSPAVAVPLAKRKAQLLLPVVARFGHFIERGELPAWSPLVFDVVLLGATHEACRRFLAGAELDPRWMRTTLPALAWAQIATAASSKKTPPTQGTASSHAAPAAAIGDVASTPARAAKRAAQTSRTPRGKKEAGGRRAARR